MVEYYFLPQSGTVPGTQFYVKKGKGEGGYLHDESYGNFGREGKQKRNISAKNLT